MKKRAAGLGLNIWGGTRPSKTGVFNTLPLSVRVESVSSTPHRTNWDYKLASQTTIDAVSATGMLIYDVADYSSNKYDYYYGTHKGKTPNLYNFEIDWYSNDVDMVDDIAVVATKEWTSTEKYTYELSSDSLTIDAIFNATVVCQDMGSETNCNLPTYSYEGTFDTGVIQGPTAIAVGTITITYVDECGVTKTSTIAVNSPDGTPPGHYQVTVCSSSPPTASYSGTGQIIDLSLSAITPAQSCSNEAPTDGCSYGRYGLVSNFGATKKCCYNSFTTYSVDTTQYIPITMTTTMNIKIFNEELQNPNFLQPPRANFAPCPIGTFSTNPEYPDYSDVFIEIHYRTADVANTKVSEVQVYSYGGIMTRSEYIAKANLVTPKLPANATGGGVGYQPPPVPFTDDDGFKWYIVVRENTGEYLFTTLSTYMRPAIVLSNTLATSYYADDALVEPTFRKLYNKPTDNGTLLSLSSDGTYLITNNIIPLQAAVKVIKIANFPSCGKVDVYKKKTGGITSYAGKTITYANHGLSNGDLVKFSSAISITGITNVNGVKYVSGVTANTFNIYHDSRFTSGVPIQNLKNVTGVNWSSNGWSYVHSLYSPMGKNGYGFTPQVRTVVETGVVEGSIYTRAIESSKKEGNLTRPQAYLNSWTSWSNFFPFKRIGNTARSNSVIYESYGGTRFGSDCQISKVSDNNYILMVTEPGTELSFQILDEFYNKSYIPANKYVIPHYLPYGRIHFYNVTKTPYTISYLTSVSQSENPFSSYETRNLASKREGYNFATNNYDLTVDNSGIKTYLANNDITKLPVSEYWLGARYYSWNREYTSVNNIAGLDMPDQQAFPYEYGFLDSLGVSAAFEIESGNLHCVASTYVKSADFYSPTKSRVQYVDALSEAFSINLTTNEVSSLSGIPVQTNYSTKDHSLQNAELELYASNTDFDDRQLFIGWMSANRYPESLYIYDRIGSGYNLKQTINNNIQAKGFGNYFVADNGFLVTNAYNSIDNNGEVTEDLNYLYLYTQDRNDSNRIYNFTQKISSTIDLENSNYVGTNIRNYALTKNISYDNTTENSATSKVNLDGRYDIYNNSLVLRDYNEYAYFIYDSSSGVFICKNHHLITDNNLLTQLAVLRMRPSDASFIVDNSTAEYIQSLEVLEASEDFKSIKIINQSYINPTYLPLFMKALNGIEKTLPLYSQGHIPQNSGLTIAMEAEALYNSGLTLVAKQQEIHTSGLRLFIKQPDVKLSGINMFIQQTTSNGNITLVMPQQNYTSMPLIIRPNDSIFIDQSGNPIEIASGDIGNYIFPYERGLALRIENYHTGVPNGSGVGPLFIKTHEYDDVAIKMHMSILSDPLPSGYSGTQDLFMYIPSGQTNFHTSELYIEGPQFETGYPSNIGMHLIMFRTPEAQIPLFVYNTYTSGNLDMSIKSANLHNSGTMLYTSGEAFPVSYSDLTTLYLRGN